MVATQEQTHKMPIWRGRGEAGPGGGGGGGEAGGRDTVPIGIHIHLLDEHE